MNKVKKKVLTEGSEGKGKKVKKKVKKSQDAEKTGKRKIKKV